MTNLSLIFVCAWLNFLGLAATHAQTVSDVVQAGAPSEFPELSTNRDLIAHYVGLLLVKQKQLSPEFRQTAKQKLVNYVSFLGIPLANEGRQEFQEVTRRIFNSSTQFLFCGDLEDWQCLESESEIQPNTDWRKATAPDLGKPVAAGFRLKSEIYFTQRWRKEIAGLDNQGKTMAEVLGQKILKYSRGPMQMALYGIDDIDASMKPVYSAISQRVARGDSVRGVFDVEAPSIADNEKMLFTYSQPAQEFFGTWMFSGNPVFKLFQYLGTVDLIRQMNAGVADEKDARARIEWEPHGIMHNKFFVLQDRRKHFVWTGTTNVARTCMGEERNSNLSVWIQNEGISEAFREEFNEMFEYSGESYVDSKGRFVNAAGGVDILKGRFHNNKRPNTKRYFVFDDGTEVRVHFSPTDDGEHRAILPMILSARRGDWIRIAMFGGAGIEYVRAFQLAASRGVKIQITMDRLTGSTNGAWNNNPIARITDPNPFVHTGNQSIAQPIEFRYDDWPGQNHHKTASLSRLLKNGKYRAEVLITGSQNWSFSGNDINDENMLTIRKRNGRLWLAEAFNNEFDQYLWPNSIEGIR